MMAEANEEHLMKALPPISVTDLSQILSIGITPHTVYDGAINICSPPLPKELTYPGMNTAVRAVLPLKAPPPIDFKPLR